jgi:hypothetical protein
MRIVTNNVPRDVLEAYDLTPAEREEFEYIDFHKVATGEASATFIRYRGTLYNLAEFQTPRGLPEFSPLQKWDGYLSDSYFSGIVLRYVDEFERVIVGTFLA